MVNTDKIEIGEGIWRVLYRQKLLGYFEEKMLRIQDELGRLKEAMCKEFTDTVVNDELNSTY